MQQTRSPKAPGLPSLTWTTATITTPLPPITSISRWQTTAAAKTKTSEQRSRRLPQTNQTAVPPHAKRTTSWSQSRHQKPTERRRSRLPCLRPQQAHSRPMVRLPRLSLHHLERPRAHPLQRPPRPRGRLLHHRNLRRARRPQRRPRRRHHDPLRQHRRLNLEEAQKNSQERRHRRPRRFHRQQETGACLACCAEGEDGWEEVGRGAVSDAGSEV